MDLKLHLKRGAMLAAANWPVVAVQFAAQTTFQVLIGVPIIGAAVLVAIMLGGDLANLLQGSMREIFTAITDALISEPFAFSAFIVAFGIALLGGSVLMFLVKGGTVDIIRRANEQCGDIETRPVTLTTVADGAAFSIRGFLHGCSRLFTPYLRLGLALMLAYGLTGSAYLAFIVYGYRAAGDGLFFVGWTVLAAIATLVLFLWVTLVNLIYLLLQIAMASGHTTLAAAARQTLRFGRAEFRELSAIFLVVFGLVVAAWLASALAWSGVGLIAFVPLVGLAVFPLQIAALVLRGLVFEYIGVTAMGAYITLYQRFEAAEAARASATASIDDPTLRTAH